MNWVTVDDISGTLLELAANDDIDGFTKLLNHNTTSVDRVGQWYVRQKGSKKIVLENRTPLMVASMYGSLEVMKKILSLSDSDVNRYAGSDQTTALHCAASCGSLNAVEAVKLLLSNGANPSVMDADSSRPMDMICASPEFPDLKETLQNLLRTNDGVSRVNQYAADIQESLYSTDEFRIFCYKVIPCSRLYYHDMTDCPFAHPGEDAHRRDPQRFDYSCVACPDYKKGNCIRGDMCMYAHGMLESWLHPDQYRTQYCRLGMNCNRPVCFFAHNQEELRQKDVVSPLPSGKRTFNWQYLPVRSSRSSHFSDQSMFLPGNNMSVFNQNQSMSPRSLGAISSMRARGLYLAPDYQHRQPYIRSFSSHGLGSTSDDQLSKWGSSSRVQSSHFSDQSTFRNNWSTFNQLQQQQNIISPFDVNFLPKSAPFGVQSMFPRNVEAISPMGGTSGLKVSHQNQNLQELRSLSSSERGSNLVNPWSERGSSSRKPDWAVDKAEPNLRWHQSLVNETRGEVKEGAVCDGDGSNLENDHEQMDEAIYSIEQMQLDGLVDQPNSIGRQYVSDMVTNMEIEKKSNS